MSRFPAVTFVVLAVLVTSSRSLNQAYESVNDKYECPRGNLWSLMEITNSLKVQKDISCYMVASPRTYEAARQFCHQHQARLMSLIKPYGNFRTPIQSRILDLLYANGVTKFWYGYYVRSGRLRKDTFPMTQLRDTNFTLTAFVSVPWYDNSTFPSHGEPQGSSECFQMAVNFNVTCQPSVETSPTGGGLAKRSVRNQRTSSLDAPSSGSLQSLRVELNTMTKRDLRDLKSLALTETESEAGIRFKRQTSDSSCENQRTSVRSSDCGDSLPFVCVKPALLKTNVTLRRLDPLCQPDEFGHVNFPLCFSFGQERVNHTTAKARCEEWNQDGQRPRTLFRPVSDDSSSSSSSFLVESIVQAIRGNLIETEVPLWRNSLAWVGRRDERQGEACLAVSMETFDLLSWDCSALLPFYICQSAVKLPEAGNFTVQVTNRLQPGVPIEGSTIAGTRDTQISVPFELAMPNADVSPSFYCAYNVRMVAGLQTMAVLKRGLPLAQFPSPPRVVPVARLARQASRGERAELTVQLKSGVGDGEGGSRRGMTDYYWCEVNDLKSGLVLPSGRVFLRAKGVEMYAVSIAMTPPVDSDRRRLIRLSLLGSEETEERTIFSGLSFEKFDYRVLGYRPELTPPESNRTIVDFHLFNKTVTPEDTPVTNTSLRTAQQVIRSIVDRFGQPEVTGTYRFDPGSLQVKSIDICAYTSQYDPVSRKTYAIPDTNLGKVFTSTDICLSNGEPYMRLACDGDKLFGAGWSKFTPTSGCRYETADTSATTAKLKNISESDITEASLDEVMKNTTEAVTAIDTLVPVDLVYLADILQKSADLGTVSTQNGKKILELVDTVVKVNRTVLEQSNALGNATNRILRAIDALGDKLVLPRTDNSNVRLVSDTTALEVWDLSRVTGDVIVGLELRLDGQEPVRVLDSQDLVSLFDTFLPTYGQTDAAILLPGTFIRRIQKDNVGKEVRLAMNVFANTTLFQLGRLQLAPSQYAAQAALNSKVIAARVSVDGLPVSGLRGYNVTTVYLPVQRLPLESHAENNTCVFWDFSGAGGQGAWSGEGCRYQSSLRGRDVCVCDHLTNFAVLLDFYGQSALPEGDQLALSIITIIGLSLSIAGLSCTVLSFLLIKKLRQGRPQQTLFNMALAMLASWVVFLAGFTRVGDYAGCIAVAALLHYFILASFMWMLMEGVLQYMLFVKVLGNDFDNYLLKTAIPAWGVPLIPVIVMLAIDTDLYNGGDRYCWMSLTPFYYSFLLPVALVMAANIAVYVMVVVNICRRGNIGSSSGVSKRVVDIRASVACFVVLGLSWVFAFFAIEDARVVFQYLFTITASLQGFLIFLIFTARDPNVRAFWWLTCCGWRKTKSDKTSSSMDPLRGKGHGPQKDRSADMALTSSEQTGSNSSSSSSGGGPHDNAVSQRTTGSSRLSPPSSQGPGFDNHTYVRE